MGLYLNLASIVSVVTDSTGDDTLDAQVKIRRLVNEKGPGFCLITNWPFLRSDISFSITSSANKYSGASYLPENFKRVLGAHLVDTNNSWIPVYEDAISERYKWANPNVNNQGAPDKFCITRAESGYYQIEFNRLPDQSYTFEVDIELKWTPATSTTATLIVTDDYMEAFTHFISMARARQQGDLELYGFLKSEWWDKNDSQGSILGRALASIKAVLRQQGLKPPEPTHVYNDYNEGA